MNSLQLIVECHKRGYLSKEAAEEVLVVRDRLVKEAFARQAKVLVLELMDGHFEKEAVKIPSSILNTFRGVPGKAKSMLGGIKDPIWAAATSNLAKLMALGGGISAGGAGITAIQHSREDKAMRKKIEKAYPAMLKLHPDLNEHDPQRVRRNFQVLATYAPSLAANPVVAGTWSVEHAQRGRIAPQEIKALAETQTAIDRSAGKEKGQHFLAHPAARNIIGLATSSMPKIKPLEL
jgi:hypothetical protein